MTSDFHGRNGPPSREGSCIFPSWAVGTPSPKLKEVLMRGTAENGAGLYSSEVRSAFKSLR